MAKPRTRSRTKVEDFTGSPAVRQVLHELEDIRGKEFSDIVDDAGHQYVDLVMEGGGVLGIALVGYTYVLEEMGIRFLGVGGTSAGSINAMLLAALAPREQKKSPRTLELLANLDMYSFVDGDDDARDFIRAALSGAGRFKLALKLAQVVDNFDDHLGLNPGDVFHHWLTVALKGAGIHTLADLNERLAATPPGLRRRDGRPLRDGDADGYLALVAAEITTETKVEFPRMAPLFWAEPDRVNPADFVRASMSIPFFFHPFRVTDIPQGQEAWERWNQLAGYRGPIPLECVFVDGGIMSNFPIDLFHQPNRVPTAPTFGVKLGTDRNRVRDVDGIGRFAGAIFDSARHCLDYDFIRRNPDYRRLVQEIDTRDHHWLNFEMTAERRIDLFGLGARAAGEFLKAFDWAQYKEVRRQLAGAFQVA